MELEESLSITESLTLAATPQAGLDVHDAFATKTVFQGGELGLYGEYYRGQWAFDGLFKVALGRSEQHVNIAGSTLLSTVGVLTPFTGGLLAQTTNIGSYDRRVTDVVPELGFNIAYLVSPRMRVTCGYSLVYWPHVVRPDLAIDTDGQRLVYPGPDDGCASQRPRAAGLQLQR